MGANLILPAGSAASTTADPVTRSLRVEPNHYLTSDSTLGTPTDGNKCTISFWLKRNSTGYRSNLIGAGTGNSDWEHLYITTGDRIAIDDYHTGTNNYQINWEPLLRDPSNWYHITFVYDGTQSAISDKYKLFINNEQATANYTYGTPSTPYASGFNKSGNYQYVGRSSSSSSEVCKVYLADIHLIDGQVKSPTDFAESNGYGGYKPIAYSGTFGTNGFHLKLDDSSDIGSDSSGNSNDFTATNLASSDVMLDVPTKNYATINPLNGEDSSHAGYAEGNLHVTYTNSGQATTFGANMAFPKTGKWYAEVYIKSYGTPDSTRPRIGICRSDYDLTPFNNDAGQLQNADCFHYQKGGDKKGNNAAASSYGASHTTGDIIGVAFDSDNGTLTFYKNGTSQGQAFSGLTKEYILATTGYDTSNSSTDDSVILNFGQDPTFAGNYTGTPDSAEWAHDPPAGYNSLNTSNLDDPTIKPHEYFNTVLWAGSGSQDNDISGVGFQPDFTWVKNRTSSREHALHDSVRGAGNELRSNSTNTESDKSTMFGPFQSDGFRLAESSVGGAYNDSGNNYVAWNWKESSSAGFDIVTWTGNSGDTDGSSSVQNVSHSLGVAPEMIIAKDRTDDSGNGAGANGNWCVYHKDLSSDYYLNLNSTSSEAQHEGYLFSSIGASTVGFGNDLSYSYEALNMDYSEYYGSDPDTYVAYLFSSVEGVSKVGSYTGNGSADGPFVYTGFRPAFVMVKAIDAAYSWYIHDTARSPHNYSDLELTANSSGAEYSVSGASAGERLDFLSNGFKHRTSNAAMNQSGYKYAYLAFAESPFKHANAR